MPTAVRFSMSVDGAETENVCLWIVVATCSDYFSDG
jgi:hypothetical protein